MKANELRIGNLIYGVSERIETVIGLGNKTISVYPGKLIDAQMFFSEDDFEPIPLTGEWLMKFGFKKNERRLENVYNLGIFEYATSCETVDLEIQHLEGVATYTTETKYVHQLQNLYFALIGEELTIK
jgi:hypothetical protein